MFISNFKLRSHLHSALYKRSKFNSNLFYDETTLILLGGGGGGLSTIEVY